MPVMEQERTPAVTTDANHGNRELSTNYEMFIGALSVLSIFNLVVIVFFSQSDLAQICLIIGIFLSVIFISDFGYRFATANDRRWYFLHQYGYLDLLSSLPIEQLKILRFARIIRVYRLMRRYGARTLVRTFVAERAQSALLVLGFAIILLLEFGGWLEYRIESVAGGNIQSASDGVWYTFVTITTVGYGDRYPITNAGRLVGMLIMIAGVALFGTLTGYLANAFLAPPKPQVPTADELIGMPAPQAAVVDLQRLVAESRAAHDALEAKVSELQDLLS